ncbi:MAG: TonB-dependent receptor, partial [Bacteroidetes bacterium]|nr:TonB-dependent receptor [Bacteroidota bacterium]
MHTTLRRAAILFIFMGLSHALSVTSAHTAPPTPTAIPPNTAQQNTIAGTVLDPSGQPLAGATITLRETLSGRIRAGAVSDTQGRFSVGPVAQGTYRLRVSFVGFNADVRELSVGTTPTEPLEIALTTGAFEQPELVVTASRAERGQSAVTTSQLTRADFERLPDAKDLPVQLATLPAVTFHSENGNGIGYTTLRMRGFSERRMA